MPRKLTPYLWFDKEVEEAANFYVSVFGDGEIRRVDQIGEGEPGEPGSVLSVEFRLRDQEFVAFNGGPMFKFTEAVSFQIDCADQAEVDHFWDRLSEGGEPSQCGWLKDKYGLSWQVTPTVLIDLLRDEDAAKADRVMQAMLQMSKIEIAELERAAAGG